MNIHESLVPILQGINFANRYKVICEKHSDFDNSMSDYDREFIRDYVLSKGIKVTYVKSESFFKIIEKIGAVKVQFNIIPKRGFLQFIWDVTKGGERLNLGWGMWESITRELENIEVKKPLFTSIEELEEILSEAFLIYDDFKKGLLASQA